MSNLDPSLFVSVRSLFSGIPDILIIRNRIQDHGFKTTAGYLKGLTCLLKREFKFVMVTTLKKMHLEFLKNRNLHSFGSVQTFLNSVRICF